MKKISKDNNFIKKITLDEKTIITKSKEVEHERKAAIFDILTSNTCEVLEDDFLGPYEISLSIIDNNFLKISIFSITSKRLINTSIDLTGCKKLIKDYFLICESYYDAIKNLSPSQIETIDMARRATHNEGSEWVVKKLAKKISLDFSTARRLFTLICVLHIKIL